MSSMASPSPDAVLAINTERITRLRPAAKKTQSVLDWLFRLDAVVSPGITQAQFRRLFARCSDCGSVMTKRVFPGHECIEQTAANDTDSSVINLVSDDE